MRWKVERLDMGITPVKCPDTARGLTSAINTYMDWFSSDDTLGHSQGLVSGLAIDLVFSVGKTQKHS
jgi:hypothetical protein